MGPVNTCSPIPHPPFLFPVPVWMAEPLSHLGYRWKVLGLVCFSSSTPALSVPFGERQKWRERWWGVCVGVWPSASFKATWARATQQGRKTWLRLPHPSKASACFSLGLSLLISASAPGVLQNDWESGMRSFTGRKALPVWTAAYLCYYRVFQQRLQSLVRKVQGRRGEGRNRPCLCC